MKLGLSEVVKVSTLNERGRPHGCLYVGIGNLGMRYSMQRIGIDLWTRTGQTRPSTANPRRNIHPRVSSAGLWGASTT